MVIALWGFLCSIPAQAQNNPDVDTAKTYVMADKMPEYPGGTQALRQFVANEMTYPEEARKLGIEGKVFVKFAVEKNGQVGRVSVARGVHPLLDKEALRVVNAMPAWAPGKQGDHPVAVWFTLPIDFKNL